MKTTRKPIHRVAALLLAAVMALGLLPTFSVEAQAADVPSSIKMTQCPFEGSYNSPTLKRCLYHAFAFNVNGSDTYGFCMDHSKGMKRSYIGQNWVKPTVYSGDSDVRKLLDWYYTKYFKSIQIENENPGITYADGLKLYPGYSTKAMRESDNAWVQACLWIEKAGKLPTARDAKIELLIKEMNAVLRDLYPTSEWAKKDDDFKREWFNTIFDYEYGGELLTKHDFYIYYHSTNNTVQPILVPVGDNQPEEIPPEVYITFDKVDQNGDPLKGAVFNVWNEDFTKQSQTQITTTGKAGEVYGPIELWDGFTRGTINIVEERAPQGYSKNTKSYSIEVDVEQNNTPDNPAKLTTKILNPQIPTGTPGSLKKIDAATGQGIGPATFNFNGQAKDGSAVDADFITDEDGNAVIQWTDPTGDNYIKPGQYTVTETVAPPGYEKTDEARHIVLDIDADGNAISSGNMVFTNDKKGTLLIKKMTDDGAPLAGAVFKIYRDGQLLMTKETDNGGEIIYNGDGNGIATGLYTVEEVTPPAGYLLPEVYWQNVYVDAENQDIKEYVLNFTNSTYPEIKITKTDKETVHEIFAKSSC